MPKPPKTKPATRPRTRNAEATRRTLLAAGEALFAKHGFDGATVDAIVDHAKVNKALIAYYFKSKAGLYEAIIADVVAVVLARAEAAELPALAPTERLAAWIRVLTEAIAARPTFASILMREYLDGRMQTRKAPAQTIAGLFRTTEAIYADGRKAGVFREMEPHLLHLSIVGAIVFFMLTAPFREAVRRKGILDLSTPDTEALIMHMQTMVVEGARRRD